MFSPGGQGPTTVPSVSQVELISSPGAVMSGWTRPIRSPTYVVWPSASMALGAELSLISPLEEKSDRCRFERARGDRDHPRGLGERVEAHRDVPAAGVARGEHDGDAPGDDRPGGDGDRVAGVELAVAVAPRVVDHVDAPEPRLVEHVVVGGHDRGGEEHLTDREAVERGVRGDAVPAPVLHGAGVGRDDAGHVGAVAAADVGVAVGALVLGHHEGGVGVRRLVGVLRAEQRDVVLDVVGEVGVRRVAAGVDDGDGHALAGEALRPQGARGGRGGRHGVGGGRVEQLDALVGVDVAGDAAGHRGSQVGDRSGDQGEREAVHRLHGESEVAQRRDLAGRRYGVERRDGAPAGGALGEQAGEPGVAGGTDGGGAGGGLGVGGGDAGQRQHGGGGAGERDQPGAQVRHGWVPSRWCPVNAAAPHRVTPGLLRLGLAAPPVGGRRRLSRPR